MSRRQVAVGVALVGLAAGSIGAGGPGGAARAQEAGRAYLPLGLRSRAMAALPTARAVTPAAPSATVAPSATRRPTETQVPAPPTVTRLPTSTQTPTTPADAGWIGGRIVFEERPLDEGFGVPGGPQIELRLCAGEPGGRCPLAQWRRVAAATTDARGAFVFRGPAELGEGESYQVWWVNDDTEEVQGDAAFMKRWWSRVIEGFGPGDEIDLGTFDVTDLKYVAICNDCGQTLPITFQWRARARRSETYRWSLFRGCGDIGNRERAYRTAPLGHVSEYTLEAPPPGFRTDEKYCWYVFVEDGQNGTGWPFFDWRVAFLPQP